MTTLAAERRAAATASPRTMADVLRDLGDVPLDRIWFHPAPGTATVKDVVEIRERWNRLCELVDGVLVEKRMGYEESVLAIWIAGIVGAFVDSRKLGLVSGADGMVQLFPGLVRIPDVAFASVATLQARDAEAGDAVPGLAPDLVIEVLSLGNTPAEMDLKREQYMRAGVKLHWR